MLAKYDSGILLALDQMNDILSWYLLEYRAQRYCDKDFIACAIRHRAKIKSNPKIFRQLIIFYTSIKKVRAPLVFPKSLFSIFRASSKNR